MISWPLKEATRVTVRRCPQCQTARQDDGRPGCACRADESAPEPDFTPLHVRPFVRVAEAADREVPAAENPAAGRHTPESVGAAPAPAAGPDQAPVPERQGQDTELTATARPSGSVHRGTGTGDDAARRRRRAGTVAGMSVAVAAVSAALVGGWLMLKDSLGQPVPDGYRGGPTLMVPTVGPPHPSVLPSETGVPTRAGTGAPGTSRSTASAGTATPTGSATGKPGGGGHPSPSTTSGSGPGPGPGDEPPPDDGGAPPVLSVGDTGPEVTDLQNRLKTVGGLYSDPSDGVYDQGLKDAVTTFQQWRAVQGDPAGVYAERTRAALERETGGPSA
jgi:hypothetical protein